MNKKHIIVLVILALIISFFLCGGIYFCFTGFNEGLINLLTLAEDSKVFAWNLVKWVFPLIFIIIVLINLATYFVMKFLTKERKNTSKK